MTAGTGVELRTGRLLLCRAGRGDAAELLAYLVANREHLRPWSPERDAAFHGLAEQERRLEGMERRMEAGEALHLLLRERDGGPVIGECGFTNVVRGAFQACHLGYSIAEAWQGRGLMREAVAAAVEHVFRHHGLHRVMAAYRPENGRSGALLARCGFEIEGRARNYLRIDGAWRDHVLTARINDAG